MEVAYKPKDEKVFTGEVIIDYPGLIERYEMLDQVQFEADAEGKVSTKERLKFAAGLMKSSCLMCRKYVKKVDLVHVPSGKKVKSMEQLEACPNSANFFIEVGHFLLDGVHLGKD